jgi:putative colanic acid biosynthesis acetyltransferase WcaF
MNLREFSSDGFDRGKPGFVEALWILVHGPFFCSWVPFSGPRVWILRRFGAVIGSRAVIKPGVKIKFPWRLTLGDDVWIGEDVWIDNLDEVHVGSSSCISQGAYLCTGSHDWSAPRFDLITKPIRIGSGVWIAAKAIIGPGVVVEDNAVITLGTVVSQNVPASSVYGPTGVRQRKQVK